MLIDAGSDSKILSFVNIGSSPLEFSVFFHDRS